MVKLGNDVDSNIIFQSPFPLYIYGVYGKLVKTFFIWFSETFVQIIILSDIYTAGVTLSQLSCEIFNPVFLTSLVDIPGMLDILDVQNIYIEP